MFNPVSTYRIQFHKGFNFDDFEGVIPYLEKLGISTIYASPIFRAVPGSMHGYDTVNPLEINPGIGTIEQLRKISRQLQQKGISWVQDIVPNHMAYHQDNPWLTDVLEKGPLSKYKTFFDQSLADEFFKGPIMVPFLGADLDEAIQNNEIKIAWQNQHLVFTYAGQTWPLNLNGYVTVFGNAGTESPALIQLVAQFKSIKKIKDRDAFTLAFDEWKVQLEGLKNDNAINDYLHKCLLVVNNDKAALLRIAGQQYYRLCSWKETDHQINFRRFFTVNGLICLNMQNPEVFNEFHRLIISLVRDNVFQGLRIDHVDGLFDPSGYLNQLRKLAGEDTYIVVEKILGSKEKLAPWPIQGTSGYEFLAQVNNLLTWRQSEPEFSGFYKELTGNDKPVEQLIPDKKAYILNHHMAGELDNLADLFFGVGKIAADRAEIKQAISLFLIHFPVYRFYGNHFPLKDGEAAGIKKILSGIKKSHKKLHDAIEVLEDTLLGNHKNSDEARGFYMRCMQFTGPLMAKGVEDTLMYTYERFAAHNEVGDAPGAFGISQNEFHEKMKYRQKEWPFSMNATATHDTKRGEDIRARLNLLPDIAAEWLQAVKRWQKLNRSLKQVGAPDANDEYFIYQTLMGAYPMPGEADGKFGERIQAYLEKTMREAKLHSDWAVPNEQYEAAVKQFSVALLNQTKPFWKSFTELHQKVADFGIINSLVQVLLKFTCPGVPDTYQGCEHWDLSLVDPDNRRPVDYTGHNNLLNKAERSSIKTLWKNRFNGQIKTWLVKQLLQERKQNPLLFAEGDYTPLEVKGKHAAHVLAFARCYKLTWYLTVVPLNTARLCVIQGKESTEPDWEDTRIMLPDDAPEKFNNILEGTSGTCKGEVAVKILFQTIPLALLKLSHPDGGRSTGILMHISSLPSPFGIGDMGPAAKQFADMLHQCNQCYWQLLPLGPVGAQGGYSPYSSSSSMAGNILLISPELLVEDGLLKQDDLDKHYLPVSDKVNYKAAGKVRTVLLKKAWSNFKQDDSAFLKDRYIEFCEKEVSWLSDYALYAVLKQHHKDEPWYLWPDALKQRNKEALREFCINNQDAIEKEKWLQFIFQKQWQQLKTYCNNLGIRLFGDLPFYVSYDSVDIWTNPEIFSLDEQGNMQYIAGVPPDYFNAEGQLWGMPVFNWDKLKSQNYNWWVQRITKNLELFDLLRLDHFRAFAAYWAVPATEKTARNGSWIKGPGSDFFKALKNELGELPFVAEDLGDIDDSVYELRDEFDLPGMRVLQFAFNDQLALSPHIPHNYIKHCVVYTGTHDNNTIKGWYRNETEKSVRKNIKRYVGSSIKEKHIHETFIRMVMSSVAQTAIIPLQDLLGLDETARMNVPAAAEGNWAWRLTSTELPSKLTKKLAKWTKMYNRMSG
jgi:malto-oligosyltrehalose synthase/4-alpha-glucanotransferase